MMASQFTEPNPLGLPVRPSATAFGWGGRRDGLPRALAQTQCSEPPDLAIRVPADLADGPYVSFHCHCSSARAV